MTDTHAAQRVLVLGAYGLIGASLVRDLSAHAMVVTGFGRSAQSARRVHPDIDWHIGDLRDFTRAQDWQAALAGVDAVVNAAGALQDGPRDDLVAVHHHAIAALAQACAEQGVALVQISAAGARPEARTEFMRSKAAGDAAVQNAQGEHWILRPGLVLARTGYGGTALLRMLAAVPVVQPLALAKAPIQSIGIDDLASAVRACLERRIPSGTCADLLEQEPQPLASVIAAMRDWLGFTPARAVIALPDWALAPIAKGADALAYLGWRSPLRSTAVQTLKAGVTGDPAPWQRAGGAPMGALKTTLAAMPSRAEDRLSARMALLMPLSVTILALFWFLSGAIGLARLPSAAQTLIDVNWPNGLAYASVVFWAFVDMALAAAILWRPLAKKACIGMALVCVIYLISASLVTPILWLDPLGPLVKILPALMLSLVTRALLEDR